MKPQDSFQSFYEIRVEGELGEMWTDWFEGLSIRKESAQDTECMITILYGTMSDQPALHAVLNKIRDLNLTLLSVKKCKRKGDAS